MKIKCSKCDGFLELERIYKQRYCKTCSAQYTAEHRRLKRKTPVEVAKQAARVKANNFQFRGKLEKQPCSDCGAQKAEKHHPDYSKPLEVIWLCRPCHVKLHTQLQPA